MAPAADDDAHEPRTPEPPPHGGRAPRRTLRGSLRRAPGSATSGVARIADLSVGVLLDALAEELAGRLLSRLSVAACPEHASAQHNPLGSARAFLDAGRRGDFPTFKRGRQVVARWNDVLAFIEAREIQRQVPRLTRKPTAANVPAAQLSNGSVPVPARSEDARRTAPMPLRSEDERRRELLRAAGALPPAR